jgi:hypothetical protein
MALEIYEQNIPLLITWFNNFVGFAEFQKRTRRVQEKLAAVGFEAPVLNRRFSFHLTYLNLVRRNRLCQRINIRDIDNSNALSFVASIREATKILSDRGRIRLRARLIDSLHHENDIRPLQHEMRAFVHYRQAGYKVDLVDFDETDRFDLLVHGNAGEFEVECKTFSEDIGSAITIEESFGFFRAIKRALTLSPSFAASGILTLTIPRRSTLSEVEIAERLVQFIERAPRETQSPEVHLLFDRKPHWDDLIRCNNPGPIIEEISTHREAQNPHALIAISRQRALMVCIRSEQKPRIARYICDRLKTASDQLSKKRPGVIWAHFLGLDENQFSRLLERRGRLNTSADSESVRMQGYSRIIQSRSQSLSNSGPAYDLTSNVSSFEPNRTADRAPAVPIAVA